VIEDGKGVEGTLRNRTASSQIEAFELIEDIRQTSAFGCLEAEVEGSLRVNGNRYKQEWCFCEAARSSDMRCRRRRLRRFIQGGTGFGRCLF